MSTWTMPVVALESTSSTIVIPNDGMIHRVLPKMGDAPKWIVT